VGRLCWGDLIMAQEGTAVVRVGNTELSLQKNTQVLLGLVKWGASTRGMLMLQYGTIRVWTTQSSNEVLDFDRADLLVATANTLFVAYNSEYLISVPLESLYSDITVLLGNLFLRPLQIKDKLEILFGPLDKANWVRLTEGSTLKVITSKDENNFPTFSTIKYFKELDYYSLQQILDQLYQQKFVPYHRFYQGLSMYLAAGVGDFMGQALSNTPTGLLSSALDYRPYTLGLRYTFKEGSFVRLLTKLQNFNTGGSSSILVEPILESGLMWGRFAAGVGVGSGLWASSGVLTPLPTAHLFGSVAVNAFGDAFVELGPVAGVHLGQSSVGIPMTLFYLMQVALNWKM